MDANGAVELLKGWAALIGAISWPLVIIFALLFFGRPLRAFL
jgi:heme O synthase-like polyprenyltransferase